MTRGAPTDEARRRPPSSVLGAAIACCVALLAPAPAAAAPAIAVVGDCGYGGAQVALAASGLAPRQNAIVELMGTADPLAGAPLAARDVTIGPTGELTTQLDVPAADGTRLVKRSVRVRPAPDPSLGIPTLLASAPLTTAGRGVSVTPRASAGAVGGIERWRVTGLPEGTRMWAHYRHGGATVASVALGEARDPCGRLAFALRTLPRDLERAGAWDLWLTSKSTFRIAREGVYVRRRMTVAGSGAARVRFDAPRFRLVASDPRVGAAPTTPVKADTSQIGVIRALFLGDAQGTPVEFFERIDDRLKPLGTVQAAPGVPTILEDAATWSCSRRTRRIVATSALPSGVSAIGADTVRTPSCARRFQIAAPRRAVRGETFAVRVIDRWGNGAITPRLCVTAPGRDETCRPLLFPSAVSIVSRKFRVARRGTWRVVLRVPGGGASSSVLIGAQDAGSDAAPTVLATGDSMMLGLDRFLADELAGTAAVHSDVRPGRGISKWTADWTKIARSQVAAVSPEITVMLIGGADGYAMSTPGLGPVECCGEPWIAEYTRRVRAMMASYLRTGRVLWATLPLPESPPRAEISRAVNAAIERAAQGIPGVGIVRLDRLFTPDGFSESIRWRGRRDIVREEDGVHLNYRGQAIAAKVIAQLIRSAPPGGPS